MFSIGFFEIDPKIQDKLRKKYHNDVIEEIEPQRHICRVRLSAIWNKDYKTLSFPKFKFLLYSKKGEELDFVNDYPMSAALCVDVVFDNDYVSIFKNVWGAIQKFIFKKVQSNEFTLVSEIADEIKKKCDFSEYKARTISEILIASMDSYRKNFAKTQTPIARERTTPDGSSYQFNVAVNSYFSWVEKGFDNIDRETKDGTLYLINDTGNRTKEYGVILGILEALDCLTFEMLGGANSQLYIYVNQVQSLINIINAPNRYRNRLLDMVAERHLISVKMLTYIYEGGFSNDEMWDLIEDYFLGKIPEKVERDCKKEKPDIIFD
jgi:DEAD/DEAH box helicase domain protein